MGPLVDSILTHARDAQQRLMQLPAAAALEVSMAHASRRTRLEHAFQTQHAERELRALLALWPTRRDADVFLGGATSDAAACIDATGKRPNIRFSDAEWAAGVAVRLQLPILAPPGVSSTAWCCRSCTVSRGEASAAATNAAAAGSAAGSDDADMPPGGAYKAPKPHTAHEVALCDLQRKTIVARHNNVRDAIASEARPLVNQTAHGSKPITVNKEWDLHANGYARLNPSDTSTCKADVVITVNGINPFIVERRIVDVTGTHPGALCRNESQRAAMDISPALPASEEGRWATLAAVKKIKDYEERVTITSPATFVPFAFETGGRLCDQARMFISWLATKRYLAEQSTSIGRSTPYSIIRRRIVESVSAAIFRGNAVMRMTYVDFARKHANPSAAAAAA